MEQAVPTLWALQRRGDEGDGQTGRPTDSKTRGGGPRIRCPLCGWVPDGGKHWGCEDCHAIFDTFVTRAHCPRCPKSWRDTQCIRCGEMSPHVDWYVSDRGE